MRSYPIRQQPLWVVALSLVILAGALPANAQSPSEWRQIEQLITRPAPDTATLGKLYRMADAYLHKPGSDSADFRAARFIAGQLKTLGNKRNDSLAIGLSYLLTAKLFREEGRSAAGRPASQHAVRLMEQYGTDDLRAQAVLELGGSYTNETADLPLKISLYQRGAALYHTTGNRFSEGSMKEFIGDLQMLNEQYAEAISTMEEALALYEAVGYERLHGIYSLLATAHNFLNHFEAAFRYNLLAIKTAEQLQETSTMLANIYNRVGLTYSNVDYYEQAIRYYNKALQVYWSNADTVGAKIVLYNIANVLHRADRFTACYDTLKTIWKLGQYDQEILNIWTTKLAVSASLLAGDAASAKDQYNKLLAYYRAPETSEAVRQAIRPHLADYLQRNGEWTACSQLIDETFSIHPSTPIPLTARRLAERLAYQVDSARHNMLGAFEHQKQYKFWTDSLRSGIHSKQIALLQVAFETQQKDKDIQMLQQKAAFQETSLHQEKLYRYAIITGAIILVIFLALLYSRYRMKKKAARQLEEKQAEINRQNEKLTRLLGEKEWLLKEVHHRVKNNLQIVISLLNTQSKYLESEDAIGAIRNSQQRMYAMSLIHQRLYQTDNMGQIDMHWYIAELTQYLKESFDTGDRIRFMTEVEDMNLIVIQAVPIGLILNEAVSNAIKYAFPDGRKGIVRVSLKNPDQQQGILTISDNGVGIADTGYLLNNGSLGMSLIYGLAEQLEGDLALHSEGNGLTITLAFPFRPITEETVRQPPLAKLPAFVVSINT